MKNCNLLLITNGVIKMVKTYFGALSMLQDTGRL